MLPVRSYPFIYCPLAVPARPRERERENEMHRSKDGQETRAWKQHWRWREEEGKAQ